MRQKGMFFELSGSSKVVELITDCETQTIIT